MKRLLQKMQKIVAFRQRKGSILGKSAANRKGLTSGFTLIELLVAALIASLLVVVLLSFLVGVLDSDRKETAKSNAQEEIQAAISYIADDLQEAVYIYGSEALASVNPQLPHTQATNPSSECNPTTPTCTPVLVFWKRYTYNPTVVATYSKPSTGTDKIGCMPYRDVPSAIPPNLSKTNCDAATSPYGGDRYTYSLVAYYLKNDSGSTGSTWSNTARILRWELRDGYVAYCYNGNPITDAVNCPQTYTTRLPVATSPLISTNGIFLLDATNYFIVPSIGFNRPDFVSSGTLSSLSGQWKKFDNYQFTNTPFTTLIDFIDDTPYSASPASGTGSSDGNSSATGDGTTTTAAIQIPVGKNVPTANLVFGTSVNPDCDNPSIGVGNSNPAVAVTNPSGAVTQRIPDDFGNATSNPSGLTSFYACVAPESVTARIYIRGNAIARLTTPTVSRDSFTRTPNNNNQPFFPTVNTRAFGRSAIGIKTK